MSLPYKLLAGLLLVLASLAFGWRQGSKSVQGEWDAAELQRERAVQVLGGQERRRQANEADKFEGERNRLRLQLQEARYGLQQDLATPVACSASGSVLTFGAVPVPGAVLDRLRRAGADQPASGASAAQPGR